jgi:transcriptional regulator with XRE-family HTH domain
MDTTDPATCLTRLPSAEVGPTALRVLLGARLRRCREAAGVAPADAGYAIRASASKISRMELGRTTFKRRDVEDLLRLYRVEGSAERSTVVELAAQANAPVWWQEFGDIVPEWFGDYLGMEQASSRIRTYSSQQIPELLQTREYAWAVIECMHPHATGWENERRVELRMRRRQMLNREGGPTLWAILDEAALLRTAGDAVTMRGQLECLIEATQSPKVRLQVLPLGAGGHMTNGAPVTILRFREDELPDLVYLEQLTHGQTVSKASDFDHYWGVMNTLAVEAAPPRETSGRLQDILART